MSKQKKSTADIVTVVRGKVEHDYPRAFYERNKEALMKDGYTLKQKEKEVEQTVISSPSQITEDGTSMPN